MQTAAFFWDKSHISSEKMPNKTKLKERELQWDKIGQFGKPKMQETDVMQTSKKQRNKNENHGNRREEDSETKEGKKRKESGRER